MHVLTAKKRAIRSWVLSCDRCNQHVFCVTRSLETNEDVVEELLLKGASHMIFYVLLGNDEILK